jgi:prefoldin subunit 5
LNLGYADVHATLIRFCLQERVDYRFTDSGDDEEDVAAVERAQQGFDKLVETFGALRAKIDVLCVQFPFLAPILTPFALLLAGLSGRQGVDAEVQLDEIAERMKELHLEFEKVQAAVPQQDFEELVKLSKEQHAQYEKELGEIRTLLSVAQSKAERLQAVERELASLQREVKALRTAKAELLEQKHELERQKAELEPKARMLPVVESKVKELTEAIEEYMGEEQEDVTVRKLQLFEQGLGRYQRSYEDGQKKLVPQLQLLTTGLNSCQEAFDRFERGLADYTRQHRELLSEIRSLSEQALECPEAEESLKAAFQRLNGLKKPDGSLEDLRTKLGQQRLAQQRCERDLLECGQALQFIGKQRELLESVNRFLTALPERFDDWWVSQCSSMRAATTLVPEAEAPAESGGVPRQQWSTKLLEMSVGVPLGVLFARDRFDLKMIRDKESREAHLRLVNQGVDVRWLLRCFLPGEVVTAEVIGNRIATELQVHPGRKAPYLKVAHGLFPGLIECKLRGQGGVLSDECAGPIARLIEHRVGQMKNWLNRD